MVSGSLQRIGIPVLDGFGEVARLDALRALEVGDRARDAQEAVVAAGGEAQALKGAFEQLFARGIQLAEAAHHRGLHLRVTQHVRAGEALLLGTHMLVLDAGRVQQFGSPEEILARPATEFVRKLVARQRHTCDLAEDQLCACEHSGAARAEAALAAR